MLQGNRTVGESLKERGVSRRAFLKFCASMAAVLALPSSYVPRIAEAIATATKPVLVWLEFQDCAGNSESMLRSSHPTVADFVLDALSWEYHETLMAGAGKQAEAVLANVVKDQAGKYLAVVEGSIPTAEGGVYCTIGGRTALDIAREVCSKAAATVAVGDCAWDGGFVQHGPTGAVGIQAAVPGIDVINMAGCPHNSANTAAVLVHYLTFGRMPATDQLGRPLFAYGDLIHNQCERRAYYDAGLFAQRWDDEGHRKGYCLYKLGCKGPATNFNCPNVRWNDGTSWPVEAGHGCIGCASHNFWAVMSPFYERLPSVPGFGADSSAESLGLKVVGAVAAGTAAHAVLKAGQAIVDRRVSPAAPSGGLPEPRQGANDAEDHN
jgi:hydrogenase small subunit